MFLYHYNFKLNMFFFVFELTIVLFQYFYSIKDISIGGRCVCNGHADVCDKPDPDDPYLLQCNCQHNTCGSKCEKCCPGYIQKKWQPASYTETFNCERKFY